VLVPALLLVGSWAVRRPDTIRRFFPILGLCYALPAFDELTNLTRVQLSVPALVILTIMTALAARSVSVSDSARVPA